MVGILGLSEILREILTHTVFVDGMAVQPQLKLVDGTVNN